MRIVLKSPDLEDLGTKLKFMPFLIRN